MSTRKAIKEAIFHELRSGDQRGTVVCLSGAWGCGKTHLWKEIAEELSQGDNGSVGYVSLFGMASLADAKTAIFNALVLERLARNSGDAAKLAVRLGGWLAQKLPTAVAQLVNTRLGGEILTRNLDMSRMIPEGSVLCLDDLERISEGFPLQDALGYASHLADQRGCRVLVIMNEEHLNPRFGEKEASLIRAYRERVVSTYLKLETSLSDVFPYLKAPKSLKPNVGKLVLETLETARCSNLRTLIRSMENIARAQDLAAVVFDEEEIRFVTALTAEHAAGSFTDDPTFYDFHPIIFTLDKRLKGPEDDGKNAFYKKYFDGASYRADRDLHGLVRNGYLAVGSYLETRNKRVSVPSSLLGKLLGGIEERRHMYLSDEEAACWIAQTQAVLSEKENNLVASQISLLYTVACIVAEIAGLETNSEMAGLAERALVSAAQRGDLSLIDPLGGKTDTRLPPAVLEAYRSEVTRASFENFRGRALDAILAKDPDECRQLIRAGLPNTAMHFLDASLLQELHATWRKDRRFYYEVLLHLVYVVTEYHVVPAQERLVAYVRAALDGTVANFLGGQEPYPAFDKSARFQLRGLLRKLGYDPDAPSASPSAGPIAFIAPSAGASSTARAGAPPEPQSHPEREDADRRGQHE
jgi:KAP-like P-loop domain-containing protein